MSIAQWKRAELIISHLIRLDEEGKDITKCRQELSDEVVRKYNWCHGCQLLAVYGLYKNGYIKDTRRKKQERIDLTGFNGRDSLDIKHAFDAIDILKKDPSMKASALKTKLGGEQSIYSFVKYYFDNDLISL